MKAIRRLLLVRLSALGDCVHATPVVEALQRQVSGIEIGWAIEPAGYELLRDLPGVHRFHVFPRNVRGWKMTRALTAFRRELMAERYDVALDLQGLTKSGLVAWLSRAPLRVGFAGAESRELNRLFLNRRRAAPASTHHVVDRNLSLFEALGLEVPSRARFVLPSWRDTEVAVLGFLAENNLAEGAFAVVNPGTTWATKLWPAARFAEVAVGLADRLPVVVTWGNADEEQAARKIVDHAASSRVVAAPETDLRELAFLIGASRLFVGNDTGPLHLAAAQQVPCVAVFGATDPLRNGPYGEGHRVLTTELDCRPCFSTRCRRRDLACLTHVSPAAVMAACEAALEAPKPPISGR